VEHQSSKSLEGHQNLLNDIGKLVESWNNWAFVVGLSDYEKYLNGYCDFLFEYVHGRRDEFSDPSATDIDTGCSPTKVNWSVADNYAVHAVRKIGDLPFDDIAADSLTVYYWGVVGVPLRHRGLLQGIEKAVPSSFSIGFQRPDCLDKFGANFIGESVRYGFLKPFVVSKIQKSLAERKLNVLSLLILGDVRTDDLPIRKVERGPEIAKDIATCDGQRVHDGFVLFSEKGAASGFCICLKDVSERALFLKQCIGFSDVYRRIL
jgi:hypothetical protein